MAKAKNKDYTAGNGKRWLVALAVIVLLAIIVTVIVILIPPNTASATELLNKASSTSFMVSQKEKSNYDSFETKVDKSKNVNNYLIVMPNEMADVQTTTITISEVLNHYDQYMLFVENNKAYKSNYKDIKNGLNGTLKVQKNLNAILAEVNKLTEQSPTYLQNAWVDFRAVYVEWLGYAKMAINGLSSAYQNGMGKTTINNLASTTILNTVSNYVEVIYDGFNKIAKDEAEAPNRNTYEYSLQGKVAGFEDFVDYYLTEDKDIKDYYFDSTIKANYEKINSYFTLYNEPNMKNAISSIEYLSNKPVVTKEYSDVEDANGAYTAVKLFLLGGV